jgi:small subunit ribosomal protein S4
LARYTDSSCRLCRRENLKLFLKGDRCFGDKCAFERRAYAPGQHGQRRGGKLSDYSQQLREKQKVKRIYGILEKQFKGLLLQSRKAKRNYRYKLCFLLLESRLDNVVYKMGFAASRTQARQLIRHNHFLVNGRRSISLHTRSKWVMS